MSKLISKPVGVVVSLIGLGMIISGLLITGTIVLIIGVTIFMSGNPEDYNKNVDGAKIVEGSEKLSIEELYNAYKDVHTPLGKPWLGHIKMIKNVCMIFGPDSNGEFVYVYKRKPDSKMWIASNPLVSMINESETEVEKHMQTTDKLDFKDAICYSIYGIDMLDDLLESFTGFIKTGQVVMNASRAEDGELYHFSEDFKLLGGKYQLYDMDENPIYDIDSPFPLKTFHIYDHRTGEEVFTMTKRILHVLAHYDFYQYGNEIGSFEKKFDLVHDTFKMQLPEGELTMRNYNSTLGLSYIVKINGKTIGSIAEKLNLTLENIFFENYIIHVYEHRYLPLMTALATMAVREEARDESTSSSSDSDD